MDSHKVSREVKRIVIVTPGQLGSNPRVVKEAVALQQAGFDVEVIATQVANFVEDRDQSILAKVPFRVTRIDFGSRRTRVPERIFQAVARLLHRWTQRQRPAEFALSGMTRRLVQAACARPADLYIAHYVAALPAVVRAAKQNGGRYAFDAEDFHLGDLPDRPAYANEKLLIRQIEAASLPGAAYVSAAAPMIAEAYCRTYRIAKPATILNVFPRGHAPPGPSPRGTRTPGPTLYWFSQTIGADRGLELAIEALSVAQSKPYLVLRGTPTHGYEATLLQIANRFGVGNRLHILPPIAPDQLELEGAHFDVGYVGETGETRNRKIALTNKLFSYLTSGLPVIASDVPAHRDIAPHFGDTLTLFQTGNVEALATALDHYLLHPERLKTAREKAWQLGQTTFAWEEEAPRLVACVEGALDGRVLRWTDPLGHQVE